MENIVFSAISALTAGFKAITIQNIIMIIVGCLLLYLRL